MTEQLKETTADIERGTDGGGLSHTVTISAELYEKVHIYIRDCSPGSSTSTPKLPSQGISVNVSQIPLPWVYSGNNHPLNVPLTDSIVVTFGSFSSVLIGWDGAAGLNALAFFLPYYDCD
jgi:hypothetical protein